MKQERKFMFIGDQLDYRSTEIVSNRVYDKDFIGSGWQYSVGELAKKYPEDWEEVTEQEGCYAIPKTETNRIPNQDQPASEMTKFEKCVIDIIGNIYSNINIKTQTPTYQEISQIAINQAKETFKQLSECQE